MHDRRILNAFTVDVEDYYHVSAFARTVRPAEWDQYPSRVVASTQRVLDLLETAGVRGTFFVLGWVAHRFPRLVRDIQRAGHEIGCHSYWHRLVYEQTPEQFRDDLRLGCAAIEDVTGSPVTLYRAPSFSIVRRSLWAMDVLAEEGIRIDSSIFPVRHDRYGIPDAERFPHRIQARSGAIWEFPPSIHAMGKVQLPVGGGGYFRLYPLRFSIHCLRRINEVCGQPFLFYVHPWELDPDQPRLPGSMLARFRHRVNLTGTARKLARLLDAFRFGTLTESLERSASACGDRPDERSIPGRSVRAEPSLTGTG